MNYKTMNIVTFGKKKENLLTALQHETVGSFLTTFNQHIQKDSLILLHCCSVIWGTAKIVSDYYYEDTRIWKDKSYPHRFKISEIQLFSSPISLNDGKYNRMLRDSHGTGWAFTFLFSPKPLPKDVSLELLKEVKLRPTISNSDFPQILNNF